MARPNVNTTVAIFPTCCNNCKEDKLLQKMYVTTNGLLQFHFCKECAHSFDEALQMQNNIIIASTPAHPGTSQR